MNCVTSFINYLFIYFVHQGACISSLTADAMADDQNGQYQSTPIVF